METDEDVVIPKVSYAEALQALQKVRFFEEQHENGDSEWIHGLITTNESCDLAGFKD